MEHDEAVLEKAYDDALAASGAAFLRAERRLLEAGEAGEALLRARAAEEAAPLASLTARALLARTRADAAVSLALGELAEIQRDAAGTVMGAPTALYVYSFLKKRHGAAAAADLAAYLNKLWPVWPAWMTAGVAMYVGEQGGPEVSDALLPLAIATSDPYQREVASRALALSGDPAVGDKLRALAAAAPEPVRTEVQAAADDVQARITAFT